MKLLEATVLSILTVFAPVQGIIIVAIVLILSDLVTGILAARKKGEAITSAGLRRTVTKISVYMAAICLGFLVEKYMLSDLLPVSKIVSALIGAVEAKSIFENLDILNGSSIFKKLVEKLGSINDEAVKQKKEDTEE